MLSAVSNQKNVKLYSTEKLLKKQKKKLTTTTKSMTPELEDDNYLLLST